MKEDVLPEGWEIKRFEGVIDIQGGSQPPKSEFIYEEQENYIRLLQIRDFGEKPVPTFVPKNRVSKFCQETDILIARYGASLGRIVTGLSGAYNVALAKTIYDKSVLNDRFVFYLLQTPIFQKPLSMISRSAQNGFAKQDIADIKIPLPPLPEQQYLSQKLTALLDEVAQTKQRLEAIPALLKQFRQSVLADAVSGRLTKEWREVQKFPITWQSKRIADLGQIFSGKTPSKSNASYWNNGSIYWISAKDMKSDEIVSSGDLITENAVKETKLKICPKETILMVIRSGIISHSFPVAITNVEVTINQDLKALLPSTNLVIPKFVFYLLKGNERKILDCCSKSGTTVASIEMPAFEKFEFRIPSIEEQTQIVQKVETYFALADEIETQVKTALENVNLLTQSILAKAFSGELSVAWRKENSQLIQIRNNNE